MEKFIWTSQQAALPALDYGRVERWIASVAAAHGKVLGPLAYIFCDDECILSVNRQFLSHDYYTDIITFDNSRGRMVSGDMFISLDTVKSNAEGIGAEYEQELMRVIIHGVLHLCGINDKGPGEREVMEAHENAALDMWSAMDE
ncbi:rRNA maturation RNase YbeY [uncultured Muribaculum sp.]|uniref:rRNA maturation RNase YbeY n=1 Tax=uncultured Muribaculum sp. TaxID=1918613 RepID=UPI0025FE9960|nr:rRNA maturation RNase YbeY [uncultured Muribaculum sp.]